MKHLAIVFALFLVQSEVVLDNASIIYAHSNHKHAKPISKQKAAEKSAEIIKRLIKETKIDSSWLDAKFETIEKKKYGKRTEWKVTYINPKTQDESKKKLYIFMKLSGAYIAANHTGK